MNIDIAHLVLAATAGIVFGAIYFASLWLTVSQLVTAKRPALLLLGSVIFRFGLLALGLFWIMDDHWERLLACIIGFVVARRLAQYISGRGVPRDASIRAD